ncbi:hypothetical protein CRE_20867 [Caenorhabditis remanei]|uniref:Uncharacterized protein n=1 Tax=Caenorhabditis remanei TaxID=31234 RepID=E3MV05_CAERE|nr:hypothetical protein CRE_20867 [Caenorhabditis remanei]
MGSHFTIRASPIIDKSWQLTSDNAGGVQALKDSVKIGAVAVTVIGGAVGGMVITSGDGKFNAKERADAAKGIGQIVSDIWNW